LVVVCSIILTLVPLSLESNGKQIELMGVMNATALFWVCNRL
jgi:hypothetical protein